MSKERRTVSLDEEVDDYLDRDGVNASELVNKLVKSHMTAGGDREVMLEMREQQLESEVQELDSRRSTKQRELEQVRDQLDEMDAEKQSVVTDAASALSREDIEYRNQKVSYWAEEAEMDKDELIEAVEEEWSQ